MPTFLADILSQIKAIWARLDSGQRMTIAAVMAATIVGIGAIVWYAGKPSLRTILVAENNLQYNDGVKALQTQGIAYVTRGLEVQVDREDVQSAMNALRAGNVVGESGAPTGMIDGLMNSSDDRRTADLVRRQQQAAEAIMRMAGVRQAVVNASKPKRSPFSSQDRISQPRATVLLRLNEGTSFMPVARGASEIVSATIPLPPEFVTVIDAVTKQTYNNDPTNPQLNTGSFREEERKLEQVYEGKAIRLLGPLQDQVRLSVTVVLDPSFKSTERDYIPPEPVVDTESTTKEERREATANSGGNATPATASPSTKKSTTDKTYLKNLGTVREGLQAPLIKSISFALTVDTKIKDDGKIPVIINTVKNALAFGDGSRVEMAPKENEVLVTDFPKQPDLPAEEGPGIMTVVDGYLPLVGQILGVLLVLLFLKSMLKRSTPKSSPSQTAAGGGASEPPEVLLEDLEKLEDMEPNETAKRMRKEIEKAIDDDPVTISRMLEGWLAEQKV